MNGAATPEPKAASTSPPPQVPLEWRFSQVFGERGAEEDVQDVDIISAIEFNKSGHHLATGDRGGRVVLFERTDAKDDAPRKEAEKADYSISRHPEFRYKTEFQSHEPEFDYLKSLEIEEKINKIKWCQGTNGASFLLSTNDKTIKFWKVQEKKVKKICEMNLDPSNAPANGSPAGNNMVGPSTRIPNGGFLRPGGPPLLRLPVVVVLDSYLKKYTLNLSDTIIVLIPCIPIELNLYILISETSVYAGFTFIFVICYIYLTFPIHQVTSQEISLAANCRRVYAHAHDYHINSISNNSDGETFISADDLRINLWNLEISNQSFNIIDVKPTNMEDLTEVITCAEFHPSHCNTLAYSSSKGSIRLVDLRQSALCDTHSQLFEQHEAPGSRSFFTEIIASISDIKFSKDGRHILSRDYMTLKLWDVNMDSGPVATFQVHEYLRPKLCDLYENDSIFDKFECCQSGDGSQVATGSYSNIFRVFNCGAGGSEVTTLEATRNPTRRQIQNPARPARSLSSLTRVVRRGAENTGIDANGNSYDLSTKLLHLAWHPDENLIACAAANSLYMYYA